VGELEKYKLYLLEVEEVRQEGGDIKYQTILYFPITTKGQEVSYIIESFQQLKGCGI
jgi:hypothetical protein